MNIQNALKLGTERLQHFSDSPQLDANWLLLHVLKQKNQSWLLTHNAKVLTLKQKIHYQKLIAERATGKPLAYVLGHWEFYGRKFMVTKYVLIPRPSTEALIDATIRYIDTSIKSGGTVDTIADIGTGSGCIAITLALEIPSLKKIYATDVSNKALNIALRNARLHQVEKKIEFIHGNLLDPIKDKQIDLVVSNPPYVPTKEIEMAGRSLKTAGLKHEPRLALDGGPDGLKFIHQLSTLAIPHIFETVGGHITQ